MSDVKRIVRRILVAGIGNIFLGDDAFGVEVAQALMRRPLPAEVWVVDFGIRGYDLAYALLDDYDAAILVDAVARGEAPGTVSLIEPDPVASNEATEPGEPSEPALDAHQMNPLQVLRMVRSLGGELRNLYLVGCEPAVLEPESGALGLSEEVSRAVPLAIGMIEALVRGLISETGKEPICAVQTKRPP